MPASLLSIKLRQPVPPPRRISRPALVKYLNEGLALGRPMTLLSAPAGSGKTTCASEWLSQLALPVAWLSLDADDNDPGRFFTYLAAALMGIRERLGADSFPQVRQVEAILNAGQVPPPDILAGTFLQDCGNAPARFLLVLDDFHLLHERAILQFFEKLLASLFQPHRQQPLHLVIIGREDPGLPLARLRASDLLTEIRAGDLHFSAQEAEEFFRFVMGLELSVSDVAALNQRTEGWVAGLQLAGLSLRGRADSTAFILNLSGSQRLVLSYLTEEVLSRQSEAVQQFLLDTALLDRMNGDLCNALTGRSDCHLLLEQLWQANLFLVPLDDAEGGQRIAGALAAGPWYRYHHLFRDLLRHRQAAQQGSKTLELHRRAGRWYAQALDISAATGAQRESARTALLVERAFLVEEAVRHALAGQDYALAVQLIETYGLHMLYQWYARVVTGWMQALPPEWSAKSPRASLAFARFHLIHGDLAQAGPYLARLHAWFSDPAVYPAESVDPYDHAGVRAEWLALQSNLLVGQGQHAEALALAQQALAIAPPSEVSVLSQVYLALALAYQQMDDAPQAENAYRQLIQTGRSAGDLVAELLGLSALGLMLIERGQLREGFELARQGVERVERAGALPPICAGLYGELGQAYFHWNQLDQAEAYLQQAAQVSGFSGFSDSDVYYAVARSRLCLIRADLEGAVREIQAAAARTREDAPVVVREEVVEQQVRVYLAQDNLAAAHQLLIQEGILIAGDAISLALAPGERVTFPKGVLYISGLRVMLHRGKQLGTAPHDSAPSVGLLQAGLECAGRLLDALRRRQYVPLMISTLLVQAQLAAAIGNEQASLESLGEAVDLAAPQGYLSDFVIEGPVCAEILALLLRRSATGSVRAGFIEQILAAFPARPLGSGLPAATQPQAQAGCVEPLTGREREVLDLVAIGCTYEEIAAKLVVSINTVRTHVKSIYGKLGVNNRTNAIDAARRLNLL